VTKMSTTEFSRKSEARMERDQMIIEQVRLESYCDIL
jgi:hypothetical protein